MLKSIALCRISQFEQNTRFYPPSLPTYRLSGQAGPILNTKVVCSRIPPAHHWFTPTDPAQDLSGPAPGGYRFLRCSCGFLANRLLLAGKAAGCPNEPRLLKALGPDDTSRDTIPKFFSPLILFILLFFLLRKKKKKKRKKEKILVIT
jgi:hypothetical protein